MVETSKQPDRFEDGELFGKLRILKLNPEALAECGGIGIPAHAEHFHLAGIGGKQTLADLHGGSLPGSVGSEQPEAFACPDLEFQSVNGDCILISLPQVAHLQSSSRRGGGHVSSIARADDLVGT